MLKIGIYSVVLRRFPLKEIISLCSKIGFDAIEIRGQLNSDFHLPIECSMLEAQGLKEFSEKGGIKIFSIATYNGMFGVKDDNHCMEELAIIEKYMKTANILNADYIRVETSRQSSDAASLDVLNKEIEWFRKTADLAENYHLNILIEMHGGCLTDSCEATRAFIENVGRNNLKVTYDVGNLFDKGFKYGSEQILSLENYIANVHIRDDKFNMNNQLEYALMGDGDIDYLPVFKTLRDIGYNGYLTVECHANPEKYGGEIAIASHELGYIKALTQQFFSEK